MVVFGGSDVGNAYNDLHHFTLPTSVGVDTKIVWSPQEVSKVQLNKFNLKIDKRKKT